MNTDRQLMRQAAPIVRALATLFNNEFDDQGALIRSLCNSDTIYENNFNKIKDSITNKDFEKRLEEQIKKKGSLDAALDQMGQFKVRKGLRGTR